MAIEIIIPQMGVNMTEAVLSKWLKQEGDPVKKGEPLLVIETDKAAFEIEAEGGGILRKKLKKDGETIPVLEVIGYIADPGEGLTFEQKSHVADKQEEKVKATPAARRLAKENSIELSLVSGTGPKGEITGEDVKSYIAIAAFEWKGKMNRAFVEELKNEADKFRILPSDKKIELYKKNGAVIGRGVNIGSGTYIIAEYLEIGNNTQIGDNCVIECNKIKLGSMDKIGSLASIRCRELIVGDLLYAVDDILVGAGGEWEPNAKLKIGNACFLGKGVVLNPCEPIILEDEVCLSPWAKIFTHSHWQSVLDGYNADFAPVKVKRGSWLGPNSFVMPGVTIGQGATVTGNSFVALDVPAFTLVGGVPAVIIKSQDHYPKRLTIEQKDAIMRNILFKFIPVLEDKGYMVKEKDIDDCMNLEIEKEGKSFNLVYGRDIGKDTINLLQKNNKAKRIIILGFNIELDKEALDKAEFSVFDLSKKSVSGPRDLLSDEIREFLRKRGIRLSPILWRYLEGLR
jgi:acetyltransferase-like isoleucine patch superfamily enzyme